MHNQDHGIPSDMSMPGHSSMSIVHANHWICGFARRQPCHLLLEFSRVRIAGKRICVAQHSLRISQLTQPCSPNGSLQHGVRGHHNVIWGCSWRFGPLQVSCWAKSTSLCSPCCQVTLQNHAAGHQRQQDPADAKASVHRHTHSDLYLAGPYAT